MKNTNLTANELDNIMRDELEEIMDDYIMSIYLYNKQNNITESEDEMKHTCYKIDDKAIYEKMRIYEKYNNVIKKSKKNI